MHDAGSALMGIGTAAGENRAAEAAKIAISSPLLEESVEGAMGILLNITGGHDLGLFEVNEAAEIVQSAADANSNIIFGAVIDDAMGDDVRVTVIATGFDHGRQRPSTARETTRRERRDRDVTMDDRQRSSLEISRRRHRHPVVPEGPLSRDARARRPSGRGRPGATGAARVLASWECPRSPRPSAEAPCTIATWRPARS